MRRVVLVCGLVLLLTTQASAQVYHFGSFGGGEEELSSPTLVPGLEDATKMDAANAFGLALVNGAVMAYGHNELGELGDGTREATATAVRVDFPAGVRIAAIGESNQAGYAIDSTGQGWAWGKAGDALCLGDVGEDVLVPKKVPGMTSAIAVQGGGPHVLWLTASHTVESCGLNPHGDLGDGTGEDSATPVEVTGLQDVVEVSAGEQSSCARTSSGAAYDWGLDRAGQVGNRAEEESVTRPFRVPLPGPASDLSCGGSLPNNGHTLALVNGVAYGWGDDEWGQLGDGTRVNKPSPTLAVELGGLTQIVASGESSLGLTKQGEVETWGHNRRDALGQGDRHGQFSLTPLSVGAGGVELSATATDAEYRT